MINTISTAWAKIICCFNFTWNIFRNTPPIRRLEQWISHFNCIILLIIIHIYTQFNKKNIFEICEKVTKPLAGHSHPLDNVGLAGAQVYHLSCKLFSFSPRKRFVSTKRKHLRKCSRWVLDVLFIYTMWVTFQTFHQRLFSHKGPSRTALSVSLNAYFCVAAWCGDYKSNWILLWDVICYVLLISYQAKGCFSGSPREKWTDKTMQWKR